MWYPEQTGNTQSLWGSYKVIKTFDSPELRKLFTRGDALRDNTVANHVSGCLRIAEAIDGPESLKEEVCRILELHEVDETVDGRDIVSFIKHSDAQSTHLSFLKALQAIDLLKTDEDKKRYQDFLLAGTLLGRKYYPFDTPVSTAALLAKCIDHGQSVGRFHLYASKGDWQNVDPTILNYALERTKKFLLNFEASMLEGRVEVKNSDLPPRYLARVLRDLATYWEPHMDNQKIDVNLKYNLRWARVVGDIYPEIMIYMPGD